MKISSFCLGILFLVIIPFGTQLNSKYVQSTPNPTQSFVVSTPIPVPTQIATVNPTASVDSIVYISEKAIEAADRSLRTMQWILGIFITVLIAVAGGLTAYVRKTLNDANIKLNETIRRYDMVVDEINTTKEQLDKITTSYLNLQSNFFELQRQTLPFDMAVVAYENGRISKEAFIESQVWHSWQKWAYADDPTGYEELIVFKETPEGLPRSVIQSAITIFVELEQNLKIPGRAKARDRDKSLKLKKLLDLVDN